MSGIGSGIGVAANKLEILHIANAVAQEKNIDKAIVLDAMAEAIQKAARSRYGLEHDIRADIDPETGETTLWRCQTVVEEIDEPDMQIILADAKAIDKSYEAGDVIKEELPPFDFGRVATQTAKQVILQRVREAERQKQFDEYKDRVGEVINGIVKREEFGHVIVDLGGGAEATIRRNDTIPREILKQGDRIRAILYKVARENRGPQLFLSRAHPELMVQLFKQEVPEIYDGVIEIRGCARDPGSRAKITVYSSDSSIDPVGACVGMRGARVQAVVGELQGEKVDIIPWSDDPATLIVNALQPAEVSKVVLDEDEQRVEAIVATEQFPLAIGRRGQNVRLATQLTGWQIDLLTEEDDSERYQKDFQERTELFMKALDVDEMLAQLLASEGFDNLEEIGYVELHDLAGIEGFDEDIATELQTRAREYLEKLAGELDQKRCDLGVVDEIAEIEGLTPDMLVKLGESDVKTMEDLAGLIADDLVGWREQGPDGKPQFEPGIFEKSEMSRFDAETLILHARVAIGWVDAEALEKHLAPDLEEETEEGDEEITVHQI